MPIKFGRIILIGIGAELLAILALVALVAVLGPADPSAAQAYAQKLGYWVGPITGFVLCLGGGWLAARGLPSHHVLNGLALGFFVALIDLALLAVGGATFELIFLASNIGRLAAGSLGGWLARR